MELSDCINWYSDGRHYDLQHMDSIKDIPFFVEQARRYGGPILELMCGTGRITIPIAEAGIDITGLDISEPMLELGKKKADDRGVEIEWIQGDCRDFHLGRTFNVVAIPGNSINHFQDRESIENCFACVQEHLVEGGRFIIDIFTPVLSALTRDPKERVFIAEYPDPDGRGTVRVTEQSTYEHATQTRNIDVYRQIGDRVESFTNLKMRMFFPQELEALLYYNGFNVEFKYGNYDESAFRSTSPKQLIVCTRAS